MSLVSGGMTSSSLSTGAQAREIVITEIVEGGLANLGRQRLREAYQRLGVPIKFMKLPGKRALEFTNEGQTDAEMHRIKGLEGRYPNLIRIKTPYIETHNSIFVLKGRPGIDGWHNLKGLKMGFRRGLKAAEILAEAHHIIPVQTIGIAESLKMLSLGRVDAVFDNVTVAKEMMNLLKINNVIEVKNLTSQVDLYHYIHRKHGHLATQLNDVFLKMKQEGKFH